MKKLIVANLFVALGLFAAAADPDCGPLLAKAANGDIKWRASVTHELAGGKTLPSNAKREAAIKKSIDLMEQEIAGKLWGDNHTDTPPMIVVPVDGTVIKFTKKWEEYGDMHAEVTGAPDGILRATVLAPVSGHTGLANAKQWAKTDTFDLTYKSGGKENSIVKGAKSMDLITAQEVEIPLQDGKPVTLLYYRSGSGGPGGYAGGRVLHLTWKKSASVAAATDFSKPFWGNRGH